MNMSFKKMLAVLALTVSVIGGDVFAVRKTNWPTLKQAAQQRGVDVDELKNRLFDAGINVIGRRANFKVNPADVARAFAQNNQPQNNQPQNNQQNQNIVIPVVSPNNINNPQQAPVNNVQAPVNNNRFVNFLSNHAFESAALANGVRMSYDGIMHAIETGNPVAGVTASVIYLAANYLLAKGLKYGYNGIQKGYNLFTSKK